MAREKRRLEHSLVGSFRVRALRSAFVVARRLLPRSADMAELREHALKLAYWPEKKPTAASGKIIDLNWSWIQSLKGQQVGELRIDDNIGGCDNLRVIFFVGDRKVKKPLPIVWVLHVIQKKRDHFTRGEVAISKARRRLVLERFY